jgi:hypothetical protein
MYNETAERYKKHLLNIISYFRGRETDYRRLSKGMVDTSTSISVDYASAAEIYKDCAEYLEDEFLLILEEEEGGKE